MQILTMALLHLKRMMKNKATFIMSIIFPALVVSIVVFFTHGINSSSSDNLLIDVVNNDSGSISGKLISNLKSSRNISIYMASQEDAERRLTNGSSSLIIVIPENFSGNIENGVSPYIKLIKLSGSNIDSTIENKINLFISKNLIYSYTSAAVKDHKPAFITSGEVFGSDLHKQLDSQHIKTVTATISKNKGGALANQLSISLEVSFMMYTMIVLVLEIGQLKKNRTLYRSISTPNSFFTIAASFILAFLFLGWLQVALLISVTKLLFNLYWGSSYIGIFIVFTALILVVMTMGLLISGFIKKDSMAPAIVNIVVTITCTIGGSFMPIEFMPDFLQKLACFTPQNWAVKALSLLVLDNKGAASVLPDVGMLLLFGLVFFTASAASLKSLT